MPFDLAALKKKVGPLPVWAWGAAGAGTIGVVTYMRRRQEEAAAVAPEETATSFLPATPAPSYQAPYGDVLDIPPVELIPPPAVELPPQEFMEPVPIELPSPEIIPPKPINLQKIFRKWLRQSTQGRDGKGKGKDKGRPAHQQGRPGPNARAARAAQRPAPARRGRR